MPGNDAGDRIHNFFGQDHSAQGQPRSQVADRNWPALTNSPWAGSQRQIVSPLFSNLKSHNVQQTAELESGHGGQPSSMQHGMNFSQSNLRADFSRNHSQGQQPTVNGYMHGHQFFHVRQNEANFLGVGAESDRQNLSSQGFAVNSALDSQQGNGPELHRKNSVRMDLTESPVNYDFFGNQQMSGQHASMMQTLQRQQSGVPDMQMLQQQVMLNQIQEMQRQQQYQKQQQASQLNGMNQVSSFAKQAAGNQSMAMINGIPIHDASNFAWQSELMAANANWPQRGTASFVPGSSGGLMLSPDQGQVHLMGMTPQQVDQSLRGVPISGSRVSSSQFSPIQVDKPTTQQISGANTSFQGNQYTGFSDQISMHDSRQGYQGKNMIGTSVDGQGINSGFDLESMHPVNPQPGNSPGQEFNSRLDTVYPSDKSQDKSMMQGAPSQSVATLDPTEEKILFGSDDNLWDAFGKGNNMGSMGCSVSDGTDIGAFSSLQSGSWSALMQSAVAETSGGNVGSQEEWSGSTFQNNGYSATNQQTQTTSVSGRNQPTWARNSSQNPSPDTAVGYNNVPVSKQSGVTTLFEQNERLQNEPSQRFPPHFPGEAAKRLDSGLPQKLVAERSHIFGKPYSSSDAGSNSKSISSHWTNQQSMPLYNAGGQPGNRPNGFNFLDAVKNQHDEQSLQGSQSINQKGPMFEAAGSGPDVWKSDNLSNSAVNLEREIASPKFKAVDSNVNAVSALPSSNTTRANQVSSPQIPNSNNIDIWKRVDSSRIPQGSDATSNLQYVTDKRQQNIDLSGDNTLANGTIETHETQNFKTKTSTVDGFYNIAKNAAAVGVKENSWLDTSDLQTIPGEKPKSSGNIVQKLPARKFQYHPMGDVDVEPPYSSKNAPHSQSTLHQISQGLKGHDQGYTFPNQIDRSSLGSEKDPFSGFQEESKGLRGTSSTSVLPGSSSSTSTPIERAANNHTPNKITPSSQNMLELFHKVDQSREHGNATQYSSLGYNQLEPKNSDGSVQLQRSHPSGSQGFSLQLGPPSQILPVQDHAFTSQGNFQKSNSTNSSHVVSGVGEKGHNWFASTSSAQSLPPSRETSQGELRNDVADSSGRIGNNAQVNFDATLSSNFPFPRRHFPNQHMNETGRQPTASPSVHTSFDSYNSQPKRINGSCGRAETSHSTTLASVRDISGKASHDNIASSTELHHPGMDNQKHTGDTAQQFPVLEATQVPQHYTLPSISQGGDSSTKSPPVWTSVPPRQNSFGAQQLKTPSNFLKSSHHSDKTSETTLFQPSKREDQSAQKGGTVQSESGQFSENSQGLTGRDQPAKGEQCQHVLQEINPAQTTMSALQGKEHFMSSSPSNPSSSQRDMEAFGRSLRPIDTIHQNYSLLNQMQGMKNAELDPENRSLKRFRSSDGAVDAQLIASQGGQQLYGHNKVVGESLTNQSSALPGDLRNVNLIAESADDQDTNASPQDMVAFGQNDSEGSNLASVRGEHSRISPQMAPSWFDRYGTFKNGQILPTYDPRKAAIMKAMEMASTSGRLPDATHGHSATEQRAAATPEAPQHGIVQKSLNAASLASENPSSQLLHLEAANTSLVVVPAKKRKSASSELVPWHKEVMHGPRKLQNISIAEVDWARASNRLPEKVGFEAVMIEDGQPVLRSKRRLILTTQLLQLLLCPPSFSVLSAEAILHHQSVIQCIARATLGDACSALSFTGGDAIVPSNGGNLIPEKLKTSERISDQFFSKVMEDLINRAKKLEDDVLRLDKRASILDLRVECQDIEKFSVINRFVKFHGNGRGQPEAAEASSSSDASTNALRVYPLRYVTALPMPRYLPDNVQCLSL